MQLLMTMEQRPPGIVGDEVERDLLEAAQHNNVLHDTRRRFASDHHEFETVTMQVERVDIVAGVTECEPIAAPLLNPVPDGPHSL